MASLISEVKAMAKPKSHKGHSMSLAPKGTEVLGLGKVTREESSLTSGGKVPGGHTCEYPQSPAGNPEDFWCVVGKKGERQANGPADPRLLDHTLQVAVV